MSPQTLAAVDLGSNSFHMIVAHIDASGHVHVLDRLREPVRLGDGLDARGNLSAAAQERALACLRRFGERIRDFHSDKVAAVGTNTLRMAKNAREFLHQAEAALGHPIAIISGREEARLIYLGVAHSLAKHQQGKRFVMDIGGGSTELIIGQGFEPLHLESLRMGCVSSSKAFFVDGRLAQANWDKAITAAQLELRPIKAAYRAIGWDSATGASGTIRAVAKVIQENGLAPYGITLANLHTIRDWMIAAGHLDQLKLAGLGDDRKPVFAGGLAILIAVFESLKIAHMEVSDGALREGLIYDRLERQYADIRDKTVQVWQQRFQLDSNYAQTVRHTALELFNRCRDAWQLPAYLGELLGWAAELHELGLAVSHNSHHKHGAYLLEHADLPGFSTEEQRWLSVLVRTHRQKLSPKLFALLDQAQYQNALYLSVILRLAVLLHRSHKQVAPAIAHLQQAKNHLALRFAVDIRQQKPLLFADLQREQEFLKAVRFDLVIL